MQSLSLTEIKEFFTTGHERSVKAKKNILGSFVFKGGSVLISLLLVPLTLNYLNPVKYGIWLTLISILGWIELFDIGLGNGLRNKFTESVALGEDNLAKIYVSTSYLFLTIIIISVYILFIICNSFIDWTRVLNTPEYLKMELNKLVFIVFTFFCIQFVIKLLSTILIAYQKPAYSDFIYFISNFVTLIVIYSLTIFTSSSLLNLGIAYSCVPLIILTLASIYAYSGELKNIRPTFRSINFHYAKELYSLGIKFFVIQISALIIYTTDNIIISNILGPAEVTPYNIAFKYFNIIMIAFAIILRPIWSSATDAYTKKDFNWIKNAFKKNYFIWKLLVLITLIMILVSPYVYKIWVGNEIQIPFRLTLLMGIYVIANSFMFPIISLINGIGKIKLQLIISIITGIINIPLSIFFVKFFSMGSAGVILGTIVSLVPFIILISIQYKKIINKQAYGIWNA
jgi:O-antigen/teichoic acid export membrane protein